MIDLSPYKLTVLAVITVALLAAAMAEIFGSTAAATQYLGVIAPTLVALLALLRGEKNAVELKEAKEVTQASIDNLAAIHATMATATDEKLEQLRAAVDNHATAAESPKEGV
jgi:hypothetical protein